MALVDHDRPQICDMFSPEKVMSNQEVNLDRREQQSI